MDILIINSTSTPSPDDDPSEPNHTSANIALVIVLFSLVYMPCLLTIPYILRYRARYGPLAMRLPMFSVWMLIFGFGMFCTATFRLISHTCNPVRGFAAWARSATWLLFTTAAVIRQVNLWKKFVRADRRNVHFSNFVLCVFVLLFVTPLLGSNLMIGEQYLTDERLGFFQLFYAVVFEVAMVYFVHELFDPQRVHTSRKSSVVEAVCTAVVSTTVVSVSILATNFEHANIDYAMARAALSFEICMMALGPCIAFLSVVLRPMLHHLSDDQSYVEHTMADALLQSHQHLLYTINGVGHQDPPGFRKWLACFPVSWLFPADWNDDDPFVAVAASPGPGTPKGSHSIPASPNMSHSPAVGGGGATQGSGGTPPRNASFGDLGNSFGTTTSHQTLPRAAVSRRPPGFDDLVRRIHDGHFNAVDKILSHGGVELLHYTDETGRTPLHHAIEAAEFDIAAHLLALGSDARARTNDGSTPVHLAAAADNSRLIVALHGAGADVNEPTSLGASPLHSAIKYGRLGALATLLSLGADVNVPGGPAGSCRDRDTVHVHELRCVQLGFECKTPLFYAVECGAEEVVAFLCHTRKGVIDLEAPCCHGVTPLHIAALLGHASLVRFLLTTGNVSPWTFNSKEGCNVFHYAALGGSVDVAKLLLTHMLRVGGGGGQLTDGSSVIDGDGPMLSPISRHLPNNSSNTPPQQMASRAPLSPSLASTDLGSPNSGLFGTMRGSGNNGNGLNGSNGSIALPGHQTQYTAVRTLVRTVTPEQVADAEAKMGHFGLVYVPGMSAAAITERVDEAAYELTESGRPREAQELQYAWFVVFHVAALRQEEQQDRDGVDRRDKDKNDDDQGEEEGAELRTFASPHIKVEQLLCARDLTHRTPLHYAVLRGHPATCRILIQHGADPGLRDIRIVNTSLLGLTSWEYVDTFLSQASYARRRNIYLSVQSEMHRGVQLRNASLNALAPITSSMPKQQQHKTNNNNNNDSSSAPTSTKSIYPDEDPDEGR